MVREDKKRGNRAKMNAAQNVIFRVAIVLGMAAAVVTILYFTPVPGESVLSLISFNCNYLNLTK